MNYRFIPTGLNITKKWPSVAAISTLMLVTFACYVSILTRDFTFIWDDVDYIVNNADIQNITVSNIKAVFSKFYVGNYAPLHLMTYMFDFQLWGLNPIGYHLGNLLLHILNGVLLYRLLIKLEIDHIPALFGSAIFLLHPVQVESVAWISERKNVLSGLLFLLSLHSYINYRSAEKHAVRHYVLSLLFLTSAVLSKSIAVIFPAVIACYDFCYRTNRQSIKLIDKLPFILIALAASVLTVISQSRELGGGRMGYPGGTPVTTLWTMIPVFIAYLKDLVNPVNLSPYYIIQIRESMDTDVVTAIFALLFLGTLGILLLKYRPRLLFFFAVYFFSLLPVLQIVPILTLKNDRYLYFPMMGVAGVLGIFLMSLLNCRMGFIRKSAIVLSLAVSCILGGMTFRQVQNWQNPVILWQYALEQNPENMLAWLMLAKEHTKLGHTGEAMISLDTYMRLKQKYGPLRGWDGIGS